MIDLLVRAAVFLGTAAIGILVAAAFLPGLTVSAWGIVVAIVVFAVAQTLVSALGKRLTRERGRLLVAVVGLASTLIALLLATLVPGGLAVEGFATWVWATLIIWPVTAVAGWLVPKVALRPRPSC